MVLDPGDSTGMTGAVASPEENPRKKAQRLATGENMAGPATVQSPAPDPLSTSVGRSARHPANCRRHVRETAHVTRSPCAHRRLCHACRCRPRPGPAADRGGTLHPCGRRRATPSATRPTSRATGSPKAMPRSCARKATGRWPPAPTPGPPPAPTPRPSCSMPTTCTPGPRSPARCWPSSRTRAASATTCRSMPLAPPGPPTSGRRRRPPRPPRWSCCPRR